MLLRPLVSGLCALIGFAGGLRAQDSGLPARDSAEAQALISKLQGLAAAEPDRAEEVNAYLHPLTRAAAAASESEEEGPAPAPKTMFLVRTPGGTSAMRATASEKQGAVLIVTTASGSKVIVQAANVLGEVPWYSEDDIDGGRVDLEALAQQYEEAAGSAPALRDYLHREAERYRKIVERSNAEIEGNAKEIRDDVQKVTALEFDPASPPTAEEIAKALDAAEALIVEHPETAGEIDAWAAPFREHLGHLLDGDEWKDGKWISAADRAAAAEKARVEQIRRGLSLPIDGSVAPAAAIRKVFMIAVWSACALAAIALLCVAFARGTIRLAGVIVLTLVPLGFAAAFYLASRDPSDLPSPPATADETPVVDLLLAGTPATQPAKLEEDSINAFLARRLRMSPAAGPDDAARRGLAVRLQPGQIGVFELVRAFGFDWIVRYKFAFRIDDGQPFIESSEVWVGRLRCPGQLAGILLKSLEPDLAGTLATTKLPAEFTPANLSEREILLVPVAASKPAEPPAPQPEQEEAGGA